MKEYNPSLELYGCEYTSTTTNENTTKDGAYSILLELGLILKVWGNECRSDTSSRKSKSVGTQGSYLAKNIIGVHVH